MAYTIKVFEQRLIILSPALGSAIRPMASNNNVDIEFFDDLGDPSRAGVYLEIQLVPEW